MMAGSIVATMIIGFNWGGWVLGRTAEAMAAKAAAGARAELAAAVCVHQFVSASNASAQMAALQGTDTWKRDTFIEDGGWVTLPGSEKLIAGAAVICSQALIDERPSTKSTTAAPSG